MVTHGSSPKLFVRVTKRLRSIPLTILQPPSTNLSSQHQPPSLYSTPLYLLSSLSPVEYHRHCQPRCRNALGTKHFSSLRVTSRRDTEVSTAIHLSTSAPGKLYLWTNSSTRAHRVALDITNYMLLRYGGRRRFYTSTRGPPVTCLSFGTAGLT